MYQKTIVVGHLGRDPEMRYLPSGQPVTNFSIATTRKWTDAEGQPQEKTTWFRVAVWGKQAEIANQYLTKGQLVLVEGDIDASSWTDREGQARASLELRAWNFRMLGRKGERVEAPEEAPPEAEEDIPF